ncbi:hypothetical protein BGZ81_006254 [Podila clonocystis]|nr:hypothetical protein BGZ81_006254 [Podila clonocystis]
MLRQHNARSQTPEMHLDALFKEPAWYASSTSGTKGKKAAKRQQDAGHLHHIDPFNAPVHLLHPVAYHSQAAPIRHVNEEGYYLNHQPIHGWQHQDSTHGATYKHPTQHRAVRRHHNAPIGTPEMHLESVFKEPKAIPIRSAPHNFCHKDCAEDDDYEIGYRHIRDHHSYQDASDRSHSSHDHDDHNEEGYYMNHQPIHGYARHGSSQGPIYKRPTQHRAVHPKRAIHQHNNASIGTPDMHLDSVFKEPDWYTSSSLSGSKKGKKALQRQQNGHSLIYPAASHSPSKPQHKDEEGYYMNHQPIHVHAQHPDLSHGTLYKRPTQHRAVHRHHNAPIGTPEMHLDALFKEPASWTRSRGVKASTGHYVEPFNAPAHRMRPAASHAQPSAHDDDEETYYLNHQPTSGHHQNLLSHEEPSHAPVKNPQRKMEGSAVWNVGSLPNHTPSWAMHAHLPAKKPQRKAEDSTVWNLGSLLDDTPSWAMGARLPTRKPQRKAEDSAVWNLGSLFDDTTSVRSSKDCHAAKPLSVTSSSSSRNQSRPLTVDQIARVAVPIGQTETYTTVIRTTVTLMDVPSSLAHDTQHIQAERGHVLTDFSGPVSRAGQTSIWVRKESSKEVFEGDRMVCQNCRRSLSRL